MLWHPDAPTDDTIALNAEAHSASITIGPVRRPWNDFVTETPWMLRRTDDRRGGTTTLSCSVLAYAHGDNGLAQFLVEAARDFRGWTGKREWRALENVELIATNTGRGRVGFVLRLRETADLESPVVTQPFEVEAGHSLERLAAMVRELFAD